jgi:hypothetical protein
VSHVNKPLLIALGLATATPPTKRKRRYRRDHGGDFHCRRDPRAVCSVCGVGLVKPGGVMGDGMCRKHSTTPYKYRACEPCPFDAETGQEVSA